MQDFDLKHLSHFFLNKQCFRIPFLDDYLEHVYIVLSTKDTLLPGFVIQFYIIFRVHPGFSLVENCDLLEDRRTLMPFQRQAHHINFRITDSQRGALFCIHHDTSNGVLKCSSHNKAYFGKIFHIFII